MAFVQDAVAGFTSGTTIDVTLTGVANGNIIVCWALRVEASGTVTLTTQSGSTDAWTQPGGINGDMGNYAQSGAGYATATATGDVTVRASQPNAKDIAIHVAEFSNSTYDTSSMGDDTTDPFQLAALTPTYSGSDDAMLAAWGLDWQSPTTTQPDSDTGWTDMSNNTPTLYFSRGQYRLYTSGNVQCSFINTDDRHKMVQFVLADSGGGGGGGLTIPVALSSYRRQHQFSVG